MSFTERRLRKHCDLIAMLTSVAASACFGRARNTAVAGATIWRGKLALQGNRITRFAPVNFLNPERTIVESLPR